MKHNKKETMGHAKVALFGFFLVMEVILAMLAKNDIILNTAAVVFTAYCFYQLDNIFDFLWKVIPSWVKSKKDKLNIKKN